MNSGPQGPQDSAQHRETAGNGGDPRLYCVINGGPDGGADLQNGGKSGHGQVAQPGQCISKNILEALQGFVPVARKHAGDKIGYPGKYAQDIPGHGGQQVHRPLQAVQQGISQHFQQRGGLCPYSARHIGQGAAQGLQLAPQDHDGFPEFLAFVPQQDKPRRHRRNHSSDQRQLDVSYTRDFV